MSSTDTCYAFFLLFDGEGDFWFAVVMIGFIHACRTRSSRTLSWTQNETATYMASCCKIKANFNFKHFPCCSATTSVSKNACNTNN